jgi:phosphotransferase family enzyme
MRDLMTEEEVVLGRAAVAPHHGRNRNVMVLRSHGPSEFVKSPRPGAPAGALEVERAVLRLLHAAGGPVAAIAPRLADSGSAPPGAVVVELLRDTVSLAEVVGRRSGAAVPAAGLAGRSLGLLHRLTPTTPAPRPADQRVEPLLVPPLAGLAQLSTANLEFLRIAQGSTALLDGLAALDATLRTTRLVHGDVRLANVLVPDVDAPDRSWLVDWEFAGLGDPRADVGALMGDLMTAWVVSMPDLPRVDVSDLAPLAAFPLDVMRRSAAAALEAYLAERPVPGPERLGWLESSIAHAAGALVRGALSVGARRSSVSGHQLLLAQLAENILADPLGPGGRLIGLDAVRWNP